MDPIARHTAALILRVAYLEKNIEQRIAEQRPVRFQTEDLESMEFCLELLEEQFPDAFEAGMARAEAIRSKRA